MTQEYNILCRLGLCNRIRFAFSWWHKFLKESPNTILNVLWPINSHCNGNYHDYFIPPDNMNIIYENIEKYSVHDSGYMWLKDYSPHNIKNFYEKLIPHTDIITNIDNLMKNRRIQKYNSIHVRRTDHSNLAQKNNRYTEDYTFEQFIESSNLPVYLSTDNEITQSQYISKYPDKIFVHQPIHGNSNIKRNTTLYQTVFDLFTCIRSAQFLGSEYSSFSDLIDQKRKEYRLNA